MIGHAEVMRTLQVVRRSGVATELEDLLRPVEAGRPRALRAEVWLVGLMLAAAHAKSMTMTAVHRCLTREISAPDQVVLGLRARKPVGGFTAPISVRQVRYIGCAIEARLAHTEGRAGSEVDAPTRAARAQALQNICDRLLAATMPAHLTHNGAFAVDETGVMSWGRGTCQTDKTTGKKVSTAADPDARWGYKTANYSQPDTFFGYSVFAFTRIPAFGAPRNNAPVLTERIVVTPATNDIVAPVLRAIDRMRGQGRPVTEIAADRAWSYKVASSWADQLRDRGIEHTFDLHPNDNKVADQAGMRMIAGVAHCPAMPNDLLQITRPATLTPGADRDAFVARIEDRKQYAMTNLTSPDANGNARVQCPALSGRVSCPLRALHPLAQANDAPAIAGPPPAAGRPKCCTQRSVTIPASAQPKLRQRFTWGDESWIAAYSRRTYVEGAFGNMKNRNTENLTRGWTQVMGLVKTTLMLAALVAATNLRLLRAWATRVGDQTDPVTIPDEAEAFIQVNPATGEILDIGPPAVAA